MSAIKELYFGNIGCIQNSKTSQEWRNFSSKFSDHCEKFEKTLNDEQIAQFRKVLEDCMELNAIENANTYEYAIAIGIGIGYESFGTITK